MLHRTFVLASQTCVPFTMTAHAAAQRASRRPPGPELNLMLASPAAN